MPTYEYACTACGNAWEEEQRISAPALDTCPKCHEKTAKRQISGGNFILKGGGWYSDLYSSTKKSGDGGASASAPAKSESAGSGTGGSSSSGSGGSSSGGSSGPSTPSSSS